MTTVLYVLKMNVIYWLLFARVIKLFQILAVFLLIWNFIRVLMTYAFGFLRVCEWHIEDGNRRGLCDPHLLVSSYALNPACSNPSVTSHPGYPTHVPVFPITPVLNPHIEQSVPSVLAFDRCCHCYVLHYHCCPIRIHFFALLSTVGINHCLPYYHNWHWFDFQETDGTYKLRICKPSILDTEF